MPNDNTKQIGRSLRGIIKLAKMNLQSISPGAPPAVPSYHQPLPVSPPPPSQMDRALRTMLDEFMNQMHPCGVLNEICHRLQLPFASYRLDSAPDGSFKVSCALPARQILTFGIATQKSRAKGNAIKTTVGIAAIDAIERLAVCPADAAGIREYLQRKLRPQQTAFFGGAKRSGPDPSSLEEQTEDNLRLISIAAHKLKEQVELLDVPESGGVHKMTVLIGKIVYGEARDTARRLVFLVLNHRNRQRARRRKKR